MNDRIEKWKKDHPEKVKQYDHRYYEKNKKRIKKSKNKSCAKYYRKNRAKIIKQKKDYIKNHSDKYKALATIRSHERRGFVVEIAASIIEDLLKRNKYCSQCGTKFSRPRLKTIDRINNAQILNAETIRIICLRCNVKNSKNGEKNN